MKQRKKISSDTAHSSSISAIDLFCGVGGLTHGLERSGIDVLLGIDVDPACEYPYTTNNKAKFLKKSVADVEVADIPVTWTESETRLLAGCAPCQTFSTYNQKADKTDARWWLLLQFSRLVTEFLPEIVTMENVPKLADHKVFLDFVQALKGAKYHVSYLVVSCVEYGVPQHRQRLVLLASRFSELKLLTPEEFGATRQTVRTAIAGLPELPAGGVDKDDPLHQAAYLSEMNIRRIRASRPGGTWRDWDDELIAECHKKKSGKTYPSVYARMTWDDPAPTMTTQFYGYGNGRFGHPVQDRAISLREGAILQSFPKDYVFMHPDEPVNKTAVGRFIGNAVPVKLGEVIGKSIIRHVTAVKSGNTSRKECEDD